MNRIRRSSVNFFLKTTCSSLMSAGMMSIALCLNTQTVDAAPDGSLHATTTQLAEKRTVAKKPVAASSSRNRNVKTNAPPRRVHRNYIWRDVHKQVRSAMTVKGVAEAKTTLVALPDNFVPTTPERRRFRSGNLIIDLYARYFDQGNLVLVEIYFDEGKPMPSFFPVDFKFDDKPVPLTRFSWGVRGLFPIDSEGAIGTRSISIKSSEGFSTFAFQVRKTNYSVNNTPIYLGRFSESSKTAKPDVEKMKRIRDEQKKKAYVLTLNSPDYITNLSGYPLSNHTVTSSYYAYRTYARFVTGEDGKRRAGKPWKAPHKGLDLGAATGDPIYALANGRVVIAENMHYEGGFVVIDHGYKTFSIYMHMSQIQVKEGNYVQASERIGSAGSTGMSTGPHLHVSLFVRGASVDPLSLLSLPLRN